MRDPQRTEKSLAGIVHELRKKEVASATAMILKASMTARRLDEEAKLLVELIGSEFKVQDLGRVGNPKDGYVRRLVIYGEWDVHIDLHPDRAEICQWKNDLDGGPYERKYVEELPLYFNKEWRGRILFPIARMIALSNPTQEKE